jgi:hypothetical protein
MMASALTTLTAPLAAETLSWLLGEDDPTVATLTRRQLLGEADGAATAKLWARRNDFAPIAPILAAQQPDGAWATPGRDYQKYGGSLWQIHFLGELWADGSDPRVQAGADYAFSRQMPDGSWACNHKPASSIQCLTANVGRALARLGYSRDPRIAHALEYVVAMQREHGPLVCAADGVGSTLNGYCHMLAPKLLLFLAEVPRDCWPDGADDVRAACVEALREKQVFRCLPHGARDFAEAFWTAKPAMRRSVRETWLAEHPEPLVYGDKPGWLRFGFPLSYNSDALEALASLVEVGEPMHAAYEPAVDLVVSAADEQMRWKPRNSFNGKMLANVEKKGAPSKWLTLRALRVLAWAAR